MKRYMRFVFVFLSYNYSVAQQNKLAPDVLIINSIKLQYKLIEDSIKYFKKVERKIWRESSEGGSLEAYLLNDSIVKKITVTYYGETGNTSTSFFSERNQLFFAFDITTFYDKPIYEKGFKIRKVEENRYYFLNKKLVRWIDNKKQIVKQTSGNYSKNEKQILLDFTKYLLSSLSQ